MTRRTEDAPGAGEPEASAILVAHAACMKHSSHSSLNLMLPWKREGGGSGRWEVLGVGPLEASWPTADDTHMCDPWQLSLGSLRYLLSETRDLALPSPATALTCFSNRKQTQVHLSSAAHKFHREHVPALVAFPTDSCGGLPGIETLPLRHGLCAPCHSRGDPSPRPPTRGTC